MAISHTAPAPARRGRISHAIREAWQDGRITSTGARQRGRITASTGARQGGVIPTRHIEHRAQGGRIATGTGARGVGGFHRAPAPGKVGGFPHAPARGYGGRISISHRRVQGVIATFGHRRYSHPHIDMYVALKLSVDCAASGRWSPW